MRNKVKMNFLSILIGVLLTITGIVAFPMDLKMGFKEEKLASSMSIFMNNALKVITYFSDQLESQNNEVGVSDCEVCKIVMDALQAITHSNMTDDQAIQLVTGLCVSLGIEAEEVCYYDLVNMLPEIIYVSKDVGDNITVENQCAFMMGGTCINFSEYLPVFDWTLNFPTPEPPYVPPPQPLPTAPKLKILHMSDTHFDDHYLEGAISNCNEPLCCRANKVSSDSEIFYGGKFGGLNGDCDIPQITLESMLEYAATHFEIDLIYWTGDIPPHDVWNQTKEGNVQRIKNSCAIVRRFFPQTDLIFASVGNHESEPVNSYPVPPAYDDYDINYLYSALDSEWTTFVPNMDHSTILKGGYFSYDVKPGLRIISLNMNYCHRENWWLLVQSQDPTNQYQWLVDQLEDAEKNNIKVHLLGHQPPGSCLYVCSRNFRDILDRYKGTIAGQFYGHTHHDEFAMIYDDEDTDLPISVIQIAPSVTTASRMNPAFRIYTIDGDYSESTYQVLDYDTYWLDVNKANAEGFTTWELLYNAKFTYGLTDMTPASFDDLIDRMETDDALFQTFYKNYYRVFDNDPCEGGCKHGMLCGLRAGWSGYNTTDCPYN